MTSPLIRAIRLLAVLILALPPAAAGQDAPRCPAPRVAIGDTASRPDVRIVGRVQAEELRVGAAPEVNVELHGCAVRDTTLERTNLPRPVQPGTVYRDVSVSVEISAELGVQCLLPAALRTGTAADSAAIRSLLELCAPAATDSAGGARPRGDP